MSVRRSSSSSESNSLEGKPLLLLLVDVQLLAADEEAATPSDEAEMLRGDDSEIEAMGSPTLGPNERQSTSFWLTLSC